MQNQVVGTGGFCLSILNRIKINVLFNAVEFLRNILDVNCFNWTVLCSFKYDAVNYT